jgi:hypothetical protein
VLKIPDKWEPESIRWVEGSLLVGCEENGSDTDGPYWLLNPETGECTAYDIESSDIFIFTGTYDNRAALYVPFEQQNEDKTLIYELDNLSNLMATLPSSVCYAGDGYFVDLSAKEGSGESESIRYEKITVYSPGAKKLITLEKPELDKLCRTGQQMIIFARVSDDHKKIVLSARYAGENLAYKLGRLTEFGVFDLSTGKLLWTSGSKNLLGPPVMTGNRIYALEVKKIPEPAGEKEGAEAEEEEKAPGEVVFAVHTKNGRAVILEIPSAPGDEFSYYNYSADRGRIVLQAEGKNPRLLVIPLKDELDAKEVIEIPLPAPKSKKKPDQENDK